MGYIHFAALCCRKAAAKRDAFACVSMAVVILATRCSNKGSSGMQLASHKNSKMVVKAQRAKDWDSIILRRHVSSRDTVIGHEEESVFSNKRERLSRLPGLYENQEGH